MVSCIRHLILWAMVCGLPVGATSQNAVPAQSAKTSMMYDVASIRPMKMDGGAFTKMLPHSLMGGVFDASGVTLQDLIDLAYGVKPDRVEGAPGETDGGIYVVHAKADPVVQQQLLGMTEAEATQVQRALLQALLAERFKLRVTLKQEARSGYTLSQVAGGAKLLESRALEAGAMPGSGFSLRVQGDTWVFLQCSMERLAGMLGMFTGRTLVNKTGLTGNYDFSLKWRQSRPGAEPNPNSPELEDALPEQLGLKLKMEKSAMDVIKVDGWAKATEN